MGKLPEPDDVDFFVGGVDPDPDASAMMAAFIEQDKRRPEYRLEAEEAARILADLGIQPGAYGMPDPKSLLDHWKRCVATLREEQSPVPSVQNSQEKV